MNDLLNAYQLNSLRLTLRNFEESLRQVDAWLGGRQEHGILYRRKLSLSLQQQKAARKLIANAMKQIEDLVKGLDLQPMEDDPIGSIRGQMTVSWTSLVDTHSEKLSRYGEIDPRLANVLDPSIDRLAQAALALAQLFDGNDI